jgi:hypothetical protein
LSGSCPGAGRSGCGEPDDTSGARVDEGEPDIPQSKSRPQDFGSEEKLDIHYKKHRAEFGAETKEEYLQIARDVVNQGTRVDYKYQGEIRAGYLEFIGNNRRGESKFAFVGTNSNKEITTLHTKSGKDFWRAINGDARDKTVRPVND